MSTTPKKKTVKSPPPVQIPSHQQEKLPKFPQSPISVVKDNDADNSFELKAQSYVEELTNQIEKILQSSGYSNKVGKSKKGVPPKTNEALQANINKIVNQTMDQLKIVLDRLRSQSVKFIEDQLATLRDASPAFDKLEELKENMRDEFYNFQSDDVNQSGMFDLDIRKAKFQTRIKRLQNQVEAASPDKVQMKLNSAKVLRSMEDGVEFIIAKQKMRFHAVSVKDQEVTPKKQQHQEEEVKRSNSKLKSLKKGKQSEKTDQFSKQIPCYQRKNSQTPTTLLSSSQSQQTLLKLTPSIKQSTPFQQQAPPSLSQNLEQLKTSQATNTQSNLSNSPKPSSLPIYNKKLQPPNSHQPNSLTSSPLACVTTYAT